MANEFTWKENGLPPIVYVMLIVSAKFRSMRGASHQSDFIGSCPTVSHVFALST